MENWPIYLKKITLDHILIIGDYESGVDLILHLGDLTTLGLLSWMASLLWQDLDKVSKTIVFEYRQTIGT